VKIAAELKVPGDANVLAFLRALPAAQVVTAATKWLPTNLGSDTGLLTNVDGWLLPEPPARAFAHGHGLAVPLIIGNNAREITPQISPDELRPEIAAKYGDLAPKALAAYGLADGGEGNHDPLLGGAGSQWMTDIVQRCAAIIEADWHAAHSPTWQYQFERAIPGREAAGATHGAEVPFVFGNLDGQGAGAAAFTSADREAAQQIQEYWTRFAKTGNPNGGSLPEWPRAGSGRYLAFTATGPIVKENLQAESCRIYREWRLRELAH
jgi:para-nitrobenzyl esterase